MLEFFTKDWRGDPFILWSPSHLIGLAIVVLVNLSFVHFRTHSSEQWRRAFRYTLAAILLVNETLWNWWNWYIGAWTIQTTLPLHICSVMVFASAYMLVTKSYRIYEFIYFLGIGAASQALLTPDAGIYGFPHFRFFQVIISHGAIVTSAIYMTVVEGFRPYWSSFARVAVGGLGYMAVVFVVNLLLGSNYLFIMRKPDTASLMDLFPPWPYYIGVLLLIALVVFLVLYAPFAIQDWRTRNTVQTA